MKQLNGNALRALVMASLAIATFSRCTNTQAKPSETESFTKKGKVVSISDTSVTLIEKLSKKQQNRIDIHPLKKDSIKVKVGDYAEVQTKNNLSDGTSSVVHTFTVVKKSSKQGKK